MVLRVEEGIKVPISSILYIVNQTYQYVTYVPHRTHPTDTLPSASWGDGCTHKTHKAMSGGEDGARFGTVAIFSEPFPLDGAHFWARVLDSTPRSILSWDTERIDSES